MVETALVVILSFEVINEIMKEGIDWGQCVAPFERLNVVILDDFQNAFDDLSVWDVSNIYFPEKIDEQLFLQHDVFNLTIDLLDCEHTVSSYKTGVYFVY